MSTRAKLSLAEVALALRDEQLRRLIESLMPATRKFRDGCRGESGGELPRDLARPRRAGRAEEQEDGLPDPAGGAGQVGGGERAGFARQRRGGDGEHIPAAWCSPVSAPHTPRQLSIVPMPPCTRSSPGPDPALSKPMRTPSALVTDCLVPSMRRSVRPGMRCCRVNKPVAEPSDPAHGDSAGCPYPGRWTGHRAARWPRGVSWKARAPEAQASWRSSGSGLPSWSRPILLNLAKLWLSRAMMA